MSSSPVSASADVAATNKHRSGRVPKKPDFLVEQPASTKRKRAAPDNEDGDPSTDDEEEDDEDDIEDDSSTGEEVRERRQKTTSGAKPPAAKKSKTNGRAIDIPIRGTQQKARRQTKKSRGGALTGAGEADGLYAEIFGGDKMIEEVVSQWLQRFRRHESGALAEVINFVLKCSGTEEQVTNYDIEDVDAVTNKLGDLQESLLAQNVSDYPIISRTKAAASVKNALEEFFAVLVKTIDAADILFTNVDLIENIQIWLSTMSSAQNRPFRHTATVASLSVMTTICEIGRDTATASATSRRQSQNMGKGKGGNKKRASGLLQDAEKLQQKQALIDALAKDWFDTIFIHRYRDVEPRIRVDCAQALGGWMSIYPDVFFDVSHLRYLGWELSDSYWQARHEVIKQLTRLYQKKERLAGLKTFTERFRARMVEIATLDSEVTVRASAVELLDLLRQAGFLEPDDIDAVGRLIFDSEPRVRKAVVSFFSASVDENYESKVDDLGGQDAITEELDENADSTERPGLLWLRLKSLVEVLDIYDAVDPELAKHIAKGPGQNYRLHASDLESRFITVAESLYPHVEALQDWNVLANYLLYDTSDSSQNGVATGINAQMKEACTLNKREEYILLELLNVAVRQHVVGLVDSAAERKGKKTKKQKADIAEEQESTAREIATLMPKLLNRFGDSPQTALAVLRLERIVSLDAFQDFQQDPTTYKELLDDIEKQFLSHGSEEVLTEASLALLRAKNYSDLGEVAEEKIDEIWEETLGILRSLLPKKGVEERGNLKTETLDGVSKTVCRLVQLSQISNPIAHLNIVPPSKRSSHANSTVLSALLSLILRATLEPDLREDAEFASSEDALALHAARAVGFYLLWSISTLQKQLESLQRSSQAINVLAEEHKKYVDTLTKVVKTRQPADSISVNFTSLILDAHISAATLRQAGNKERKQQTDTPPVAGDVSHEHLTQILQVFTAVERRYASKTNRTIDKPREDNAGKRGRKQDKAGKAERPIDAEPMDEDELDRDPDDSAASDDDEEGTPSLVADTSSDESSGAEGDDDDEGEGAGEQSQASQRRTARRAALRLQSQLLAEKTLCELGSKLVLAVIAGVVDERRVRARLELNRAKLGPNWREVVRYLDSHAGAARAKAVAKGGKGALAAAAGKAQPVPAKGKKSEEIVVSSDEEDEAEEEEELDEEEEEIEREVDDEPEREVESVLGD